MIAPRTNYKKDDDLVLGQIFETDLTDSRLDVHFFRFKMTNNDLNGLSDAITKHSIRLVDYAKENPSIFDLGYHPRIENVLCKPPTNLYTKRVDVRQKSTQYCDEELVIELHEGGLIINLHMRPIKYYIGITDKDIRYYNDFLILLEEYMQISIGEFTNGLFSFYE